MIQELTNQQIEDAVLALELFNPAVSLKTKLRLSRNLRKLTAARHEKEHDRTRLVYSAITDKSKKPEQNQQGGVVLTPEEQLRFNPEYRALMSITQKVEIHPIELYDSSIEQEPIDPDHAINVHDVPIPNDVLCRLLDIVLFEHGDNRVVESLPAKAESVAA